MSLEVQAGCRLIQDVEVRPVSRLESSSDSFSPAALRPESVVARMPSWI